MKLVSVFLPGLLVLFCGKMVIAQQNSQSYFAVIAYCHGNAASIDAYPVEKLTHIIFSFCHLKGNQLAVDNATDSLSILKLVSMKARNPKLKVLLSLGGWGGCKMCSEVFSTKQGRKEFAASVNSLSKHYKTDGIDLDWEYPAIEGYPGHPYSPSDKQHFTALILELRSKLGKKQIISFAAGGFVKFFRESVEWEKVMPKLDMVNLMTYDFFHGASTATGHHTAIYSTRGQAESLDATLRYLDSIGVRRQKLVAGAAFYGRIWENVDSENNGLYRQGNFKGGVGYRGIEKYLSENQGFEEFWDEVAHAPYWYNSRLRQFLTYDNPRSIACKTTYARENGLRGIMFWQLFDDKPTQGLLDAIYEAASRN
jgi:chitinase